MPEYFPTTPHTLLCAVGTSLFSSNLSGLTSESQTDDIRAALAQGYAEQDCLGVAAQLRRLPPTERKSTRWPISSRMPTRQENGCTRGLYERGGYVKAQGH